MVGLVRDEPKLNKPWYLVLSEYVSLSCLYLLLTPKNLVHEFFVNKEGRSILLLEKSTSPSINTSCGKVVSLMQTLFNFSTSSTFTIEDSFCVHRQFEEYSFVPFIHPFPVFIFFPSKFLST